MLVVDVSKIVPGPRIVSGCRTTVYKRPVDAAFKVAVRVGVGWVTVAQITEDGSVIVDSFASDKQRRAVNKLVSDWGRS